MTSTQHLKYNYKLIITTIIIITVIIYYKLLQIKFNIEKIYNGLNSGPVLQIIHYQTAYSQSH